VAGAGPVIEILRINTDLLHNALDGVSEAHAAQRIHGANSAGFLAAHLVDARHFLAGLLGAPLPNPLAALLGDAQSADDVAELPPLADMLRAWDAIAMHLDRVLMSVTPEQLASPSPQRFPVGDPSLEAGIAFLVQHESYHVGQVALLRRQLGYPAMSYRRRER
jgi:uncharacterized damage-inducible protein DinB